jgi:hypothetical protein
MYYEEIYEDVHCNIEHRTENESNLFIYDLMAKQWAVNKTNLVDILQQL